MIKFVVNIEPVPQARPRFSRGRCFEPARCTEYKKQVAMAAKNAMAGREPMTGAVKMKIRLYRKYARCSRRYGDFDNHAKSICDALNGVVYSDDSQIISCAIEKNTDRENPRVEVEISEMAD